MHLPLHVALWGPKDRILKRHAQLLASGLEVTRLGDSSSLDFRAVSRASPQVLLVDGCCGPVPLELLRKVRSEWPQLPVVLLSEPENLGATVEALRLGLAGCAWSDIQPATLANLLIEVQAGALVVEPRLAAGLLNAAREWRRSREANGWTGSVGRLSAREEEVLSLVAGGLTNAQVARRLGLSRTTVRTHLEHVYQKLEASNRVEAVARAMASGIL